MTYAVLFFLTSHQLIRRSGQERRMFRCDEPTSISEEIMILYLGTRTSLSFSLEVPIS